MRKRILIYGLLLNTAHGNFITFEDAIKRINDHEKVQSIYNKSKAISEEANGKGSWNDPQFKISANNFPQNNLSDDKSPMTGIEFGISQKVPLTLKYRYLQNAHMTLAKSLEYDAEDQKQKLIKSFWKTIISFKKNKEETRIFTENLSWLLKILRVTKKLYANGQVSQQALLDIQIRKSEIETSLSNKIYEFTQLENNLSYLLGNNNSRINIETVPWNILDKKNRKSKDIRELSLQEKINSKEKLLIASRLNFIPDITLSLAYIKRANIDNNGNFISARVSFPMPLSSMTYSTYNKSIYEKDAAVLLHQNYKKSKFRDESILQNDISKLDSEINILGQKTINYAKNSRAITSKSYGLGKSSYLELMQSELQLQRFLLKKVTLEASRNQKKVLLKYVRGEPLYE